MQLGELQTIHGELGDLGVRVIGISADGPAQLRATVETHELRFPLYSGRDMEAAKAFGLAFRAGKAAADGLRAKGLDLTGSALEETGDLLVPGVFLIGGDGLVHFNYANPNHRVRCSAEVVLAAARAATDGSP